MNQNIRHFLFLISGILVSQCINPENKEINEKPQILTFEETEELDFEIPYILDLQKGNKHLVVYGCLHSFNPDDSMFFDIENRFISLSPDFTLNEGGEWQIFNNKDETIRKSGEQGFLRLLCMKNGIPVETFEPQPQEEYQYILSKYPKSDVLLMYFCRQTAQLQNQQEIPDFKEYMLTYISYLKSKGFPIGEPQKEYDDILHDYEKLFQKEFNWREFNPENVWPVYDNTILNRINRDITLFRDEYIVDLIEKKLAEYNKIFVLMGANHVVNQQPVLEYLFSGTD